MPPISLIVMTGCFVTPAPLSAVAVGGVRINSGAGPWAVTAERTLDAVRVPNTPAALIVKSGEVARRQKSYNDGRDEGGALALAVLALIASA